MSQSGETADVRESVKMVKEKGCLTFGIVNVVGSTIARMTDMGLYTHSGIEVGVASTKNIIGQLAVLIVMALSFGIKRDLQLKDAREIIRHLSLLPLQLEAELRDIDKLMPIIEKYSQYKNFFFLGRNILYGTAAECSLKLKELTYLHAECYSSGELKHGPLALVHPDMPCVVLNLQ
jgi:glucosamine--fructose-6-phosphate aminotransferase (isomerizing)